MLNLGILAAGDVRDSHVMLNLGTSRLSSVFKARPLRQSSCLIPTSIWHDGEVASCPGMVYYGCLMVWFTAKCLRGGAPTQIVGKQLVISPFIPSGQEIAEYIARILRGDGLHSEAPGITINLVRPMDEEELEEFEGEG